ncbi:MAG TPA: hypothetical protein VGB95_00640 [Chitinophagales bacterium]
MKTIYAMFILMLLASCGQKKIVLENESPNKQVNVTLNAEKSGISPWQCEMKVKAYSFKEGSLKFEIYAEEMNNTTVRFDWKDDANCIISITETDGKARNFQLIASPNQVQMAEI